jgi:hypothetical protein
MLNPTILISCYAGDCSIDVVQILIIFLSIQAKGAMCLLKMCKYWDKIRIMVFWDVML